MIQTERLLLRHWQEADRAAFAAIVADPEVAGPLGGARIQTPEYFEAMRDFWRLHGNGSLAIVANGALVGRVGLRRMPPEWEHPMQGEIEVGWMLARPAWGKGYATEAARAMLAWGFETLDIPEIWSWTSVGNLRSQAVMGRLGLARAPDRDFDTPGAAADDPLRRSLVYVIARPA
ncbi:MAG TPA: GNAT family N-acetyltransferase [Caulobacteraceae bacterium]|nr:GNAT family N-acetyltransferase [Caulobacteraceae bacterium]